MLIITGEYSIDHKYTYKLERIPTSSSSLFCNVSHYHYYRNGLQYKYNLHSIITFDKMYIADIKKYID